MGTTAAIALGGAAISAYAGSKGGKSGVGGANIPWWYSGAAPDLARDIEVTSNANIGAYHFDPSGNLLSRDRASMPTWDYDPKDKQWKYFTPGSVPISQNQKTLLEAQNFFANLYSNPDIEGSLDIFRDRIKFDPATGLSSDPMFKLIRERGTADAIEAGRRVSGLRSSGTSRAVGEFLTEAEAQQRIYEDERAASSAQQLYNLTMQRGQAGFTPIQSTANVLATLGGGQPSTPGQTYANSKGAGGQAAGSYLGNFAANYKKTPSDPAVPD